MTPDCRLASLPNQCQSRAFITEKEGVRKARVILSRNENLEDARNFGLLIRCKRPYRLQVSRGAVFFFIFGSAFLLQNVRDSIPFFIAKPSLLGAQPVSLDKS